MDLAIRERIIVLTSEKWVDKSALAEKIKEAIGPKKCTVLHFDELYRQAVVSLEENYTEEKALARFYESIARSVSVALMCDSYLVLDTNMNTIHDFKGLLRLVEFVRQKLVHWAEKQQRFTSPKDKDHELIKKIYKTEPPDFLLVKILADEATQEEGIKAFYKNCGDELHYSMGDEGRDLAEVLMENAIDKLEHERVKFAGLLFCENYSSYLVIREVRIGNDEDVTITLDL